MKVCVTGGTGFVGSRLVEVLLERGDAVQVLTRSVQKAKSKFAKLPSEQQDQLTLTQYDPLVPSQWAQEIAGCEAIVNLAGENLAGERWTLQKKKAIRQSRIDGTETLVEAIAQLDPKPGVMVSASAVGYYGADDQKIFTEESEPGSGFLAEICNDWEAAAAKVKDVGVRLVQVRIGIVLGPDGGALSKMMGPFQAFIGGPIGSGKQWLSWIHRDDLVGLIVAGISNAQMSGTFNATAPNPQRMEAFCQILGEVMARPSWFPVPSFALEALFGESAEVVLSGQQVLPKNAQTAGYEFKYPTLKSALQQILVS
ncbi:MAG: TIGR01777 family oxidoreductase [Cyanobacteria bacterium J06642_2]